jgi:hypothetical protein
VVDRQCFFPWSLQLHQQYPSIGAGFAAAICGHKIGHAELERVLRSCLFLLHWRIFFGFDSEASVGSSPSGLVPGGVFDGRIQRPLVVGVEQGPDRNCATFARVLLVNYRGRCVFFLFIEILCIKPYPIYRLTCGYTWRARLGIKGNRPRFLERKFINKTAVLISACV